jgi:signal transduction histidine kinase
MRINLKQFRQRILQALKLPPLSLARKCQLMFGVAVVLTLVIALLLPYVWMGQLTKKDYLESERARAEVLLLRDHFQFVELGETSPAALDGTGAAMDPNGTEIRWIRFAKGREDQLGLLTDEQKEILEYLQGKDDIDDRITFEKIEGQRYSNYVRIFRATDNCISCHNPQGLGGAFSQNESIGVIAIERSVGEISKTILLNRVWISVAGLIAGTGAIVVFYWITQRLILRPIRQLRAIANNVAEGNLDIRSSIATGDEYQKLADAFNHMLDSLQAAQEELRQANRQLDAKIVELSERNIELYKANKVKSEFLANVSHEFRTPLNAILGFAQVLREKPGLLKKEKGQRYAENILSSGNSLLSMINDVLDLAKTQAGKMELHIEAASVPKLCEALLSSFSLLTRKKKIKLRLRLDPDIPMLMTDAGKVQQILYNFLSNAVKFTPARGRIEIRAGFTSSDLFADPHFTQDSQSSRPTGPYASKTHDEDTVRIAVTDTGCGIAEADREKIFEKFRQADDSLTRESPGSGLGLAICQELATMLAGSIGMQSEPGKGATFWLDVPVTLGEGQSQTS